MTVNLVISVVRLQTWRGDKKYSGSDLPCTELPKQLEQRECNAGHVTLYNVMVDQLIVLYT